METGASTSRLRREARAIADARECPVGRKRRGRAAKMKYWIGRLSRRDSHEDECREGDREGSAGVEECNRDLVHGGLRSKDPTAAMLRLIG